MIAIKESKMVHRYQGPSCHDSDKGNQNLFIAISDQDFTIVMRNFFTNTTIENFEVENSPKNPQNTFKIL